MPEATWRCADERGNHLVIDEGAFAGNLTAVRAAIRGRTHVFQVVKGDGYGLGLAAAVRLGRNAGVDGYCVGTPAEARRLQSLAPHADTLLFTASTPAVLPELAAGGTIVTVHSIEAFRRLVDSAVPARFFLELDCGFGRYGLDPGQLREILASYAAQTTATCVGAYTHFGLAAGTLLDAGTARFDDHVRCIRQVINGPLSTMIASTDTILARPRLPYSAVDPGRLLYGLVPPPAGGCWRPVLVKLASTLTQVTRVDAGERLKIGYEEEIRFARAGRTGVFPLGWHDGLSNRHPFGTVLVGGRPVPVLARTLLHSIVDVTDVPDASPGDEVVLIGSQGRHRLDLAEMAAAQGRTSLQIHIELAGAVTRAGAVAA